MTKKPTSLATPSKENRQDEDIERLQNIVVGWRVFIWAISIILILFGISFTSQASLNNKVDAVQVQYTEIRAQLAAIQTDLAWLKKQVDE